jgi:alanine transaminase
VCRDGVAVPYYLDEANEWGMSVESLQQALDSARAEGTAVKALVVINPGNPTGQLLTYENMAGILEFCAKESIVLFADEVYQTNNYVSTLKIGGRLTVALSRLMTESGTRSGLAWLALYS